MTSGDHWNAVYAAKPEGDLSWFEDTPGRSLSWVVETGSSRADAVIDIGGGVSSLATALISDGYLNVTVLDVSHVAAERQIAGQPLIQGIVADITNWKPERRYDVWHDRAVLHFLDTAAAVASYRRALDLAVSPGGHVIIATFAPDGPARCSGLAVRRYAMSDLIEVLGPDYQPEASETFDHETPAGAVQSFHVGRFRRRAAG